MINILDVSHWNDPNELDYIALQKYFSVLIAKASQGNYTTDSAYGTHYSRAREANMVVGAYHFLDPSYSGTKNFQKFKQSIVSTNPDFYACDAEALYKKDVNGKMVEIPWTIKEVSDCIYEFLSLAAEDNKTCLLYSRPDYLLQKAPNVYKWIPRPLLWYAHYGVDIKRQNVSLNEIPLKPSFNWDDKNWTILQYSGDRWSCPEHPSTMDLSIYNGTLDEFKKLMRMVVEPSAPIRWEDAIDEWARTMGYVGIKPS